MPGDSLGKFEAEVRSFLDDHASLWSAEDGPFEWGVGVDNVALFKSTDRESEKAELAEAAIDLVPAAGLRAVAAMSELVGVGYPRSMPDSLEGTEFGRAHRLTVVDLRDLIAFRRTATTAAVESAQARGRAGVAR
jgi:hypothetical protein